MPLGDLTSEFLGGIARAAAHIVGQLVLEVLMRLPGYFFCRAFGHQVDPDGVASTLVGLLFWAVIALFGALGWFYLFGGNSAV